MAVDEEDGGAGVQEPETRRDLLRQVRRAGRPVQPAAAGEPDGERAAVRLVHRRSQRPRSEDVCDLGRTVRRPGDG